MGTRLSFRIRAYYDSTNTRWCMTHEFEFVSIMSNTVVDNLVVYPNPLDFAI